MIHGSSAETYGIVVAEGLCSGLPLVVPNVGGAHDLAGTDYAEVYPPGDAARRSSARLLNRIEKPDQSRQRCRRKTDRLPNSHSIASLPLRAWPKSVSQPEKRAIHSTDGRLLLRGKPRPKSIQTGEPGPTMYRYTAETMAGSKVPKQFSMCSTIKETPAEQLGGAVCRSRSNELGLVWRVHERLAPRGNRIIGEYCQQWADCALRVISIHGLPADKGATGPTAVSRTVPAGNEVALGTRRRLPTIPGLSSALAATA